MQAKRSTTLQREIIDSKVREGIWQTLLDVFFFSHLLFTYYPRHYLMVVLEQLRQKPPPFKGMRWRDWGDQEIVGPPNHRGMSTQHFESLLRGYPFLGRRCLHKPKAPHEAFPSGTSGEKAFTYPLRIHGTNGIFTYIWLVFMVHVGKDTSAMDPMGYKYATFFLGGGFEIRLGAILAIFWLLIYRNFKRL